MAFELNQLRERHLVETEWLQEHLADPTVRVVDMRGTVTTETGPRGEQIAKYLGRRQDYAAGHIPTAVYLDWTSDLVDESDPVPAQAARAEKLARVLGELGAQRMKFVDELTARVRTLRAEPARRGSVAGATHRAWMDAKAANASAQAHAILSECERAEDLALKAYRESLQTADVDAQTHTLVQRQYEAVQLAHDRVKQLRDSPAYAYR